MIYSELLTGRHVLVRNSSIITLLDISDDEF